MNWLRSDEDGPYVLLDYKPFKPSGGCGINFLIHWLERVNYLDYTGFRRVNHPSLEGYEARDLVINLIQIMF